MVEWLILVCEKCRELEAKAQDAQDHLTRGERDAAAKINGYMETDYAALIALWGRFDPDMKTPGRLGDLARHIRFGAPHDYDDIVDHDLPDVQKTAEKIARAHADDAPPVGFEDLLHPVIKKHSLGQYQAGYLRDAVLNGVIAVMDMIRARTKLELDGKDLVGQAFGLEAGRLVFSEIDTETGRNDQVGFMMMYQGIYTGVRNVKAHSLAHDLDETKAAQYLVMLSLLARRVDECKDRTSPPE